MEFPRNIGADDRNVWSLKPIRVVRRMVHAGEGEDRVEKSPLYLETGTGGQVGDSTFRGSSPQGGPHVDSVEPRSPSHCTPPTTHFTERGRPRCAQHHRAGKGSARPEPSTFYSLHAHVFRALEVSRSFLDIFLSKLNS